MCGACEREIAQAVQDVPTCRGLPDCPSMPVIRMFRYLVYQKADGTVQFCHEIHKRYTLEELRRMLHPTSLETAQEVRFWGSVGSGLMRKDCLVVQCVHYGLGNPSELGKRRHVELRDMLRDRVLNGQLDSSQQSEFEQNLRRSFADKMVKYHRKRRKWEREAASKRKENEKAERIEKYAAAVTADARASTYPRYFVRDHFLNRGVPDPRKTPEPATLTNFTGEHLELVKHVEKVQGLCWTREGEEPKWVYCIGWDKETVNAKALNLDQQIKAALWAEEWERLISEDGYKQVMALPLAGFPLQRTLENMLGHYAVVVPAIRDMSRSSNIMPFDASHRDGNVVVVRFDMRVQVCNMIIGTSPEVLGEYCRRRADPERAFRMSTRSFHRKKRRIKRESDVDPVVYPDAAGKYKLYFCLRGVETVDNTDIIRWTPLNGELTFHDRSFREFEGTIDCAGAWGLGRVELTGTRLAWEARQRAPGWSDFSWASAQEDGGNKEVIMIDDD